MKQIEETTLADNDFFLHFSSLVFKENHVFNEKDNPSQKVIILEKELDDIDIDDTGNLKDLPRLVFVNEESGNPKIFD